MSAHVLLNLFNEFGESDKMRGLPSILSLFHNEFNKFNKYISTNVRFYLSYDINIIIKSYFWRENVKSFCYMRDVKSVIS